MGRRAMLSVAVAGPAAATAAQPIKIDFQESPNGVQWADLRAGSGANPMPGDRVTIDYMMTRRGGAKIHSTVDEGQPFSFTLGDGSVIIGLEEAVTGGNGVPPLLPGGVRRVIVPQSRGYGVKLATWETSIRQLGPTPPDFTWVDAQGDKVNSLARFKNIYLNPNRIDQPDLLLDVKLLRVDRSSAPASQPLPTTLLQ